MLNEHVASGMRVLVSLLLVGCVAGSASADERSPEPNARILEGAPASPGITITVTTTTTRNADGEEVRRVTTQTGYSDGQGRSRTELGGFALVRGPSVPGGVVPIGPANLLGRGPGVAIGPGQHVFPQAPLGQPAPSAQSEVLVPDAQVVTGAVTRREELGRATIRGIEVIGTRWVIDPVALSGSDTVLATTRESWKDLSGRLIRTVSRASGAETTTTDYYYFPVLELPPALFDVPPGAVSPR
jgi:hypothetical protein